MAEELTRQIKEGAIDHQRVEGFMGCKWSMPPRDRDQPVQQFRGARAPAAPIAWIEKDLAPL